MIWDSIPWREELLRVATALGRRTGQRRWTERTGFLVERDIMVSAYAIRKLHEARKLSETLVAQPVPVTRYVLTGKVPDVHQHEYWESFDLAQPQQHSLVLPHLCNQIIHSFVFALSFTEDTGLFNGIYVASDRERRQHLYRVDAKDLIEVIRSVGEEDIVSVTMGTNARGERVWTNVVAGTMHPREG